MQRFVRMLAACMLLLATLSGLIGWLTPVAAQQATPVTDVPGNQPGAPVPTATDEPALNTNDEGDVGAQAEAYLIQVAFTECGTTDVGLVGSFTFRYSGEVNAADTATDCGTPADGIWSITLTNVDDPTQTYSSPIVAGNTSFGTYLVEEGTYTIIMSDGVTSTTLDGSIIVEANSYTNLYVTHFIAGDAQEEPGTIGYGSVSGFLTICQDASRADQTDFLFLAAAEAGNCSSPEENTNGFRLEGTPEDTSLTFEPQSVPVASDGSFTFPAVPFGMYRIVDLVTNEQSDLFPVGGSAGSSVSVTVVHYYADEPVNLPVLWVTKVECMVPTGDDLAGTTEFVVNRYDQEAGTGGPRPDTGTNTCYADPFGVFDQVSVALNTDPVSDFSMSGVLQGYNDWASFAPLDPGSYTITESIDAYSAQSQSFDLAIGDDVEITIVNYVEGELNQDPKGDSLIDFGGQLLYCASDALTGQVNFIIDNQPQVQAVDSSCAAAGGSQGIITLYYYGSDTESAGAPLESYAALREPDGNFMFPGWMFDLYPGYYQLGFGDTSFSDQEYFSDIFPISASGYDRNEERYYTFANRGTILVYAGAVPVTTVQVQKQICYDPDKVETSDFYVIDVPEVPENISVKSADTTTCRNLDFDDQPESFTFTLIDVATNEERPVSWDGYIPMLYTLDAVPAGTYQLRESAMGGVYTALSDPFTIDPATGGVTVIEVRNYTGTPFDTEPREFEAPFQLVAMVCQNDTFESHFEYFFNPFGVDIGMGQPESVLNGAASGDTEHCRAATAGEFAFEIEAVDDTGGLSAQAPTPLTPDPDLPWVYYYGSPTTFLAAGTYIVHEITTDSTSDPVVIGAGSDRGGPNNTNLMEFAFFPAAPTPTATATATATTPPTATATATSPNDPTATATSPAGSTPPATATATPTEPGASTPTATSTIPPDGSGVLPGRNPTATVASGGSGDPGSDGTAGGVTSLPSTGQGQQDGDTSGMLLLIGLTMSLLLAAAMLTRRKRA